jgi:crotonobetainyl-CoA:carnitine CoA-transferase CaiB-like acyl-CoA transferase
VVDFAAGLAAAVAVLAGVHRARATGIGGDLDTSLFATALSFTNYLATWTLSRGYVPERVAHGGHPSIVPSQMFATADGWLMVMCQTDGFWHALTERLGRDDLAADPRYASMRTRLEHKAALVAELEAVFATRTTAAWLERLGGHVPVAPVNDLVTALADPQLEAAGLIVGYDHPRFGPVRQIAGPVRASERASDPTPGPALGADSDAVLRDLAGLDDAAIERLCAAGVVARPVRVREERDL